MKATFSKLRNDLFWEYLHYENCEFFWCKWTGYNDEYWWNNVAPKYRIKEVIGDKGTVKTFGIDFRTNEVKELKNE